MSDHSIGLAPWLDEFTGGADIPKGDKRMERVAILQRKGLVSAKPIDTGRGYSVRVRLTDAGYALLGRAPRREI